MQSYFLNTIKWKKGVEEQQIREDWMSIQDINTESKLWSKCLTIVGNPRVNLIYSLFHHPCIHLVTFACFQSNMHDLCDLFLPNEITCYVCVLLFSFGSALFEPTWRNQHVLLWNVMEIRAFFTVIMVFMVHAYFNVNKRM